MPSVAIRDEYITMITQIALVDIEKHDEMAMAEQGCTYFITTGRGFE